MNYLNDHTGVYYRKDRMAWCAEISYKGKLYYLFISPYKSICVKIRIAAEQAIRKGNFEEFMILLKKKREAA